jgi:hypothetical protein
MDSLSDAERESLRRLKATARDREPLPDERAIAASMAAACETLADYLLSHPSSQLARMLSDIGEVDQIAVILLVIAHRTDER